MQLDISKSLSFLHQQYSRSCTCPIHSVSISVILRGVCLSLGKFTALDLLNHPSPYPRENMLPATMWESPLE